MALHLPSKMLQLYFLLTSGLSTGTVRDEQSLMLSPLCMALHEGVAPTHPSSCTAQNSTGRGTVRAPTSIFPWAEFLRPWNGTGSLLLDGNLPSTQISTLLPLPG